VKRFKFAFGIMAAILASSSAFSAERGPLEITIGNEGIIMPGGLQPYMFQTGNGTLVVQAMLPDPRDLSRSATEKYIYPPVRTLRSTDSGNTWKLWTPGKTVGVGPIFNGDGVQYKDGTILWLDWAAEGPRPGGNFVTKVWESRDDWETLLGPFEAKVHLPEGVGAGAADNGMQFPYVVLTRSVIEMPNGDLLATAYGHFRADITPSPYMPTMKKIRTLLLRSKDRGRNWSLVSTVAVDPTVGEEGFCEPVLLRLTHGKRKGRFIVHMRTGRMNPVFQTESDDEGNTWTKPHPLPFHGVDPDLIEMKNGILVSGFGVRTKEVIAWAYKRDPGGTINSPAIGSSEERRIGPEQGNYIAFSLDQGATWTQVTQVNHELTTSYVTVREVEPGRLIFVYDKNWWGHKDRAIAQRFIDIHRQ